MGKERTVLLPRQQRILSTMGENIRMNRLRRDLSAELVAKRAEIGRTTLTCLENGKEEYQFGFTLKYFLYLVWIKTY